MERCDFLPVSAEEMHERGWWWYDALVVGGDAYVDHPSFGTAVISRVLEAEGLRVAVLAQPDWHDAEAFRAMGRPRLGVFIGAGNLDSMVAHYTAAKRRRSEDFYSPGKRSGCRPDRAAVVYCNRAREAFGPDMPIILGSLEASLRRFAHYDYWDDSVRRAILFDAPADLLVYGMGEAATIEIAHRLKKKQSVRTMTDIPGTGYITRDPSVCKFDHITLPSFEDVRDDKRLYAEATRTEYAEHDPIRGRAMIQPCEGRYLIINPPAMPLDTKELDRVAELPYTREWHPMYEPLGGVPAIEEVRFSVIHNRGCFGGFLRTGVPPGPHDYEPQPRERHPRGRGHDAPPALEGVRVRCRRPVGKLPPPIVPPAAGARHVPEPAVPRADTVPEYRRRPLGLSRPSAQAAPDPRREEGVRAQRHPL